MAATQFWPTNGMGWHIRSQGRTVHCFRKYAFSRSHWSYYLPLLPESSNAIAKLSRKPDSGSFLIRPCVPANIVKFIATQRGLFLFWDSCLGRQYPIPGVPWATETCHPATPDSIRRLFLSLNLDTYRRIYKFKRVIVPS